jgi:hypothetical protein
MAGAVVLQLCVIVASLAAGFFPDAIAPDIDGVAAKTLPVLSCLATGQAAYLLLIWPLAVGPGRPLRSLLASLAMCLAISLPAWALAAVVSDAIAADVVRTLLYLLMLWPLSMVIARGQSGRRCRTIALLGMLIVTLGLPAGYYIVREFISSSPFGVAERIWQLGPLTASWDIATPRAGPWLPEPMWAMLVWPVLAGVIAVGSMGVGRKATSDVDAQAS